MRAGRTNAAIFYAFEALGMLERLHQPFFDAIHRDRLQTDKPAALNEWLGKNGVELAKVRCGDEVLRRAKQGQARNADDAGAQIDGTPAPHGAGPLHHQHEQGRTREGMLANADQLVAMVRKSLGKTK